MARKRRHAYTEEFRREAVKRSEQPGVTQAEVAKDLGLSSQQIANWKRQFTRLSDKQFNTVDGVDYSKKESEELRRPTKSSKPPTALLESLRSSMHWAFVVQKTTSPALWRNRVFEPETGKGSSTRDIA